MLTLLSAVTADTTGTEAIFHPYGAKSPGAALIPAILEAQISAGSAGSTLTITLQVRTVPTNDWVSYLYTLTGEGVTPFFYLKAGWEVRAVVTGLTDTGVTLSVLLHP